MPCLVGKEELSELLRNYWSFHPGVNGFLAVHMIKKRGLHLSITRDLFFLGIVVEAEDFMVVSGSL